MGLFDKVERGLERTVNKAFAKAFRSEVQPVEIASAIRRAMDDRATVLGPGHTMVPNRFLIELSATDFERMDEYAAAVSQDLVAAAQEHAETQRYLPGGPIEVSFAQGEELDTGVFRVRPSVSKSAKPSGMPPAPAAPPPHPSAPRGGVPGPGTGAGSPAAPPALQPPAGPSPYERPSQSATLQPPAAHQPPTINPAKRPWLDIDGERYPLLGSLTVIGRDASADVIVDDPGISRRHSEVRVTTDGPHLVCSIRDLSSTNGTFVNGERIASTRLADGDRLTVGRTTIVFRAGKR